MHIKSLLYELGKHVRLPLHIHCDNLDAKTCEITCLTSNPIYHAKNETCGYHLHFVQESVGNNTLKVTYIVGELQWTSID